MGQGVEFIEGIDPTLPLDTIRNKKNMGINLKSTAARLGEHTKEIVAGLGYSEDDRKKMPENGDVY